MCVYVFVNNSHLFIGLKLYAMKASLRQDVLFGCQKEKLKKKKNDQKGGGGSSRCPSSFSSSSLSLFLWLMTTLSLLLWFGVKIQRGEEEIIKIFLQEEGPPGFLENDVTPKSHHFPAESKGK